MLQNDTLQIIQFGLGVCGREHIVFYFFIGNVNGQKYFWLLNNFVLSELFLLCLQHRDVMVLLLID